MDILTEESDRRIIAYSKEELGFMYCREPEEVSLDEWSRMLAFSLLSRSAEEGASLTEREELVYSGSLFTIEDISSNAWRIVRLVRSKGGVKKYNQWIAEQKEKKQMNLWGGR